MQIINWDDFFTNKTFFEPTAITVGVFDGVHRGHSELLRKTAASGLFPVVITFRKSPRQFFQGSDYPGDIIPLKERLALFEAAGIKAAVLIDFSLNFSKMSARDFIKTLQNNGLMRYLVIGQDFHCGFRNEASAADVKLMNDEAETGIITEIVPPVMEDGLPVSSSRIRAAIAKKNKEAAASLLGRVI
ncbi:hypothetical protein FACS1894190_07740 [Spirochaetia bacterium]|nr:hypothetical protein FACS1894190_07740 [Spirochaetia bacterium]